MKIIYSKEVLEHKNKNLPVLALESTILAHGMPYPENLNFGKEAESLCRSSGVAPATIAIVDGDVYIGLEEEKLHFITRSKIIKKISRREIGTAIVKRWSAATTVSSTITLAHLAGVPVFATGGIGGVHENVIKSFDISEDLSALAETPNIVVSAGAKAILDLKKTVELLESLGITLLGFETNEFPAFYTHKSGIKSLTPVKSEKEIVDIYIANRKAGLSNSILVANPILKKDEIPSRKIKSIIGLALKKANQLSISGKETTPFLLKFIEEKTNGESLVANKSLALNNIKLGIKICKELNRFENKNRL
tara:strand:+ start:1191 stop:2114 length:924 start_codon:yes stop_codon:yes gene_type:complete